MNELFTHIAVCIDNSEASTDALNEAWRLHQSQGSGRISVVHVVASPMVVAGHGGMWMPDPTQMSAGAQEWLDEVAAARPGAEVVLLDGYPPAAVCTWATDAGVDLIVASSSRGLFDRVLLGSFAGYLARHAPCSVLLTRPRPVSESQADGRAVGAQHGAS